MIQFYKKRSFGDIITDTFNFVKLYGKNYFKNYLIINGLILILMMILMVLGLKDVFAFFTRDSVPDNSFVERYFSENTVLLVIVFILMFVLLIITMVINYAYPVLYMKRMAETGADSIKIDEILEDTKKNSGKLFRYILGFMFVVLPAATLIIGISYILIFIIIGVFLLILVTPVVMNTINFLLYDYLNTDKGFFDSLSYAIRSQFSYTQYSYTQYSQNSPFWKYWGATTIMYIVVQTIISIFTVLPMIIYIAADDMTLIEPKSLAIIALISNSIAILISFIVSNFIYIATGFMYYDSRTDLHRKIDLTEIESIGKNEL